MISMVTGTEYAILIVGMGIALVAGVIGAIVAFIKHNK